MSSKPTSLRKSFQPAVFFRRSTDQRRPSGLEQRRAPPETRESPHAIVSFFSGKLACSCRSQLPIANLSLSPRDSIFEQQQRPAVMSSSFRPFIRPLVSPPQEATTRANFCEVDFRRVRENPSGDGKLPIGPTENKQMAIRADSWQAHPISGEFQSATARALSAGVACKQAAAKLSIEHPLIAGLHVCEPSSLPIPATVETLPAAVVCLCFASNSPVSE
ncbi:CCT motif family protein [Striga asiatica]|uniref:CCT motif family protein n=1 Tax=Striga asiatica TaxID=4170 RepID=A0A5A7QIE1_STRAF|nr:CCT motif family protein [Striga asiatica]